MLTFFLGTLCGFVGLIVLGWIWVSVDSNDYYSEHVRKSTEDGKYVILSFDSFVNMNRADRKYFVIKKSNGYYVIYHDEYIEGKDCLYRHEYTYVMMQTKKDYKKLCEYLVIKDKNEDNYIYYGASDEVMDKIIKHYKEVAEKNRVESQKRMEEAAQTYIDVKNRK